MNIDPDKQSLDESSDESSEELVTRVTAALDHQASGLGEDIHLRLAAARRAAVAEMDRPTPRILSPWVPAAAVATTVLTVGLMSFSLSPPELPLYSGDEAQLAAENLELLSDMEFIAWMLETGELNAG